MSYSLFKQRETELEEIVRRKKTIIKKLKRDVLVLEEKVRNSFTTKLHLKVFIGCHMCRSHSSLGSRGLPIQLQPQIHVNSQ